MTQPYFGGWSRTAMTVMSRSPATQDDSARHEASKRRNSDDAGNVSLCDSAKSKERLRNEESYCMVWGLPGDSWTCNMYIYIYILKTTYSMYTSKQFIDFIVCCFTAGLPRQSLWWEKLLQSSLSRTTITFCCWDPFFLKQKYMGVSENRLNP